MIQATVLGSGTSSGHLLSVRRSEHPPSSPPSSPSLPSSSSSSSSPPRTFLAQPRSLNPPAPKPIGGVNHYDGSTYADEALTWSGKELTWTRGVEVVRRFSYDYLGQEVACATFAWFHSPEEEWTNEQASSSSDPAPVSDKARLLSKGPPPAEGTFGPFHTSQNAEWMLRPKKPRRKVVGLQRAVVAVLQTQVIIYFRTGEKYVRRIEDPVDAVWPLSTGGVLLQRKLARPIKWYSSRKASQLHRLSFDSGVGDTSVDSLSQQLEEDKDAAKPRLFTIKEMYNDPLAVGESIIDGGIGEDQRPPRLLHSVGGPSFIKSSIHVLLVAPDPYPLIVAWDEKEGTVALFRYATVADGEEADSKPAERRASSALHLRPHELMKQANTLPAARRGRASSGRVLDRRGSGAADIVDRSRRRASRLSMADEFSAAPIPSTDLAPGGRATRMSSGGGHESKLRRVSAAASMMREDVNPFNDKVLNIVAEDFRDTTMVYGLDGTRRADYGRSDTVLDRIWSWRPPTRPDSDKIRVFLSENRSATSVHLNILIPLAEDSLELYTFHIEQVSVPRPRYVVSDVRKVECVAAAPVLATRAHVFDILAIDTDGALWILGPTGSRLQVDVPRFLTADGRDEVANQFASSLSMALDGNGATIKDRRLVSLVDPSGSNVTAVYSDGERVRISVKVALPSGLCRRVLEALSFALSREEYAELSEEFLGNAHSTSSPTTPSRQWQVLARLILSKCGVTGLVPDALTTDPTLLRLARRLRPKASPPGAATHGAMLAGSTPKVLLALHLVAQDCRLSSSAEADLLLVVPVLAQLAAALKRNDWLDYWTRLMPAVLQDVNLLPSPMSVDTSLLDLFPEPPDVVAYLSRSTVVHTRPFPTPQSIFGSSSPLNEVRPCLQTELLTDIYACLSPGIQASATSTCQQRGLAVVNYMLKNGLDKRWFADVPFGVSMPVAELFRVVQQHPPPNAPPAVYTFIDRADLAMVCGTETFSILELPMGAEDNSDERSTVGDILKSVHHPGAKHAHYSALPHVRFASDKRMEEVERIMQTTRPRTVPVEDPKGISEQDILVHYQNYVNMLAQRTFAVTVGQGMWQFASRSASIGGVWHIPPLDLTVKLVPANQTMQPQLPEGAEWPTFHHAVSAALSISADSKGIDASWILYNRPSSSTITAEHGGFLLGLGLTGHLRKFGSVEAFGYLQLRHEKTTVGTLLGIAASFAGSQDAMVTRQISLHSHALLPPGAMDLNGSPLVQSTALLAIGLVYVGTKHLHMADVTLAEISRQKMEGVDTFSEYREAYSFSASMGFGLIMLGRGGKKPSAVENTMLHELTRCIYGDAPDVRNDSTRRAAPTIDPTVTSPGATLALGLMYLRTGRKDVADMLDIPQTELALENVRPDQLLVRTYARALIMWDDIRGTMEWVNEQLPSFIEHNDHKIAYAMADLNTELAYFNIVAGACLAIGIRFAGRPPESAHSVVMTFFAVLGKASAGQSMTYEGRIRRNAARQALNTVTLALSALMSGTGELNVLRRLRVSHGQEGVGVTYGSHMAMHMALGLLFLGKGYYSLGNSNIAIAALSISFFPRFLPNSSDNRAYPQLFRHLWALAVEPRCLICRDVDTRETITLPIKIKLKGRKEPQGHISPTPVAPFSTLDSIFVDSVRYWPVQYDLSNPRYKDHLVRTRTIWVKRRSAFLDYSDDPRGYRSLYIRTGVTSSYDMHHDLLSAASPLYPDPETLCELFQSHANDVAVHAISKRFMGSGALEAFMRTVLFECVVLDKLSLFPVYVGIRLALESNDGLRLIRAAQIAFLVRFYRPTVYDKDYANHNPGERRHPILRQTFLHALKRRLSVARPEQALATYLDSGVWPDANAETLALYLGGRYVPPVRVLEALRELVGRGGEERAMLEFKARAVADKYASVVAAQFDEGEGGRAVDVPQWKLDSVQDAVSVWSR